MATSTCAPYAHEEDDPRLTDYLLLRALQRDDPAVLLEEAEDWLREEGIRELR